MATTPAQLYRSLAARWASRSLVAEVIAGLKRTPRELSPRWFYDEHGSQLFDAICEQPEYYVTRTELSIMREDAQSMADAIGHDAALIELGSGTSLKTRLLLDRLDSAAVYVPIDISRTHLLDAAGSIARDYPSLDVMPLCADFTQPLELPAKAASTDRRVVYFPGSTIGNFEQEAAVELLSSMRQIVGDSGAALIGVDLRKDIDMLERAYNDAAQVTAEFNLNALRHLNRELGCDFELDQFEHRAVWAEEASRIEMHLVSTCHQVVRVGDEEFELSRGEFIRTECCHKYTLESFASLAARGGFGVRRVWLDAGRKFSVQLLEPLSPTLSH
jgi:L-histidine N-alpha-methyltransferase